jgi:hypothetical protein
MNWSPPTSTEPTGRREPATTTGATQMTTETHRPFRGRFQGRIGPVCEYAVYNDNGVTLLYRDNERETCFEGSESGAYRFAGATGYEQTARGPMALYGDRS